MKNKLIIAGIVIVIIILLVIAIVMLNNTTSTFNLENREDGSIIITAENASENSGGIAEVTIEEEQKLEVKANLEKDAPINVKVVPASANNSAEAVLDENFKQTEEREFQLPSGSYNIFVTAGNGATGNMTINIK